MNTSSKSRSTFFAQVLLSAAAAACIVVSAADHAACQGDHHIGRAVVKAPAPVR